MASHLLADEQRAYDEAARLHALAELDVLDSPPEPSFDALVARARRELGCKIALVSLVDRDRQWFKARCGLEASQTPREQAFCDHAIRGSEIFVVPDAALDPRFATNPLVTGVPHIRFYAGVPLRLTGEDGRPGPALGTLCVIDDVPGRLSASQAQALTDYARIAEALLEARAWSRRAAATVAAHGALLRRHALTNRQFRQAERMASIGSWRLTLADETVEWSDQVFAIYGLPKGATLHVDEALSHFPPRAREEVEAALSRTIATGEPYELETDFVTARGEAKRVRTLGEIERQDGVPRAIVGVFQDITARHAMEISLRRSAMEDALTGLANRACCTLELERALADHGDTDTPFALLLIDLDGFKAVNDRCGHLVGDEVLRWIAGRLRAPVLGDSFAARLGGDEFVLLVRDPVLLGDLDRVLARLLAELRCRVPASIGEIRVSGTIGAALAGAEPATASALLHAADSCLYEAKRCGKGTARVHGRSRPILAHPPAAGTPEWPLFWAEDLKRTA